MRSSVSIADASFLTDACFRRLCEHLGVAVIATDADLNIRFWNAAASRLFGAASDRMLGTSVLAVIPQERRTVAERSLRRVLKSAEIVDFEFHERDAHGEHREFIAIAAPVVGDTAEPVGTSLCIRDITRRIILQTELAESRKMAALGEMAGAIAHYFNNILGGVITSVDYAAATKDPTIMTRVLEQTGRGLLRASALVNGLLAFSQREQRADDLADFTEIINEVADDVERLHGREQLHFTINLPQLPVLPVARTQVKTVLSNIVQNAVEAMPAGGTLRIDVSLEDDRIVTAVTDSGCGLDEESRSRIFEPFWSTKGRLEASHNPVKGLGLAIAYGLVQVLGGSISVSSEVNKGSCFKVSLPRPRST